MTGLSAAGLADLAGVTEGEVERLADLGILAARDGTGPFLETDVPKVRLAVACERAGLPMEGISSAVRAGRLSFAFLEGTPFRRWAFRSGANGPPVAGRLPGWSEVAARHRGSSQRRLPTARDLTRRRELWQGR